MNRGSLALAGCCIVPLALGACAKSSKPAADTMPDMKAMEKSMMEAATPGDMQKFLTSHVGTWEGKCKFWMDPSQPPQESNCTSTITSMMDGRFTRNETHGSMMGMDGKSMPFEGFGVYGYNNTTNNFESTWCDNMGTMQMNLTGKLSSDHKVLTWNTKFMCPVQHKMIWMRQVETYNGPNAMTMEMFGPNMMDDGKEMKMGEIHFTRRGY